MCLCFFQFFNNDLETARQRDSEPRHTQDTNAADNATILRRLEFNRLVGAFESASTLVEGGEVDKPHTLQAKRGRPQAITALTWTHSRTGLQTCAAGAQRGPRTSSTRGTRAPKSRRPRSPPGRTPCSTPLSSRRDRGSRLSFPRQFPHTHILDTTLIIRSVLHPLQQVARLSPGRPNDGP